MVERKDTGWGDPQKLPAPINTTFDEFTYIQAPNGIGYYSTSYSHGLFQTLPQQPGQPLKVAAVGSQLTSNVVNEMPAISPDGSYLLYVSIGHIDNGIEHIYVTFSKGNGNWTVPINCENINSKTTLTLAPSISPDGHYLFFTRFNLTNNTSGIYWVSTHFIEKLRHSNFPPYLKSTIANQTNSVGRSFSYTIPDSTFIDDNGNNTLFYSATLSNGNPLPSWLTFNTEIKKYFRHTRYNRNIHNKSYCYRYSQCKRFSNF